MIPLLLSHRTGPNSLGANEGHAVDLVLSGILRTGGGRGDSGTISAPLSLSPPSLPVKRSAGA